MGIPFYFASLCRKHKNIIRKIKHTETELFAVDFNCFIHRYLDESDPIQSIILAFRKLLLQITAKNIYVAFDGLVPFAKIVQQRYRRMLIKDKTEFDRNQISPGTPYMKELEKTMRLNFPDIVFSMTDEPGEGEHKIFNYITTEQDIIVYGLDADLILLSLIKSQNVQLLRESDQMGGKEGFSLMNIGALKLLIPLPIDQYLILSILCWGNDFMPNLGIFSLREDGYERAINYYTECGKPDLNTFQGRTVFFEYCSEKEPEIIATLIKRRNNPGEVPVNRKNYGLKILDGVQNMESVVDAYWKTFHWTVYYFMNNEPLNWDWYYPYADAPLIQDLMEYDEYDAPKLGVCSFTITDQLQFILPSHSLREAKKKVLNTNEFYSTTRMPWLKRYDWEMKPRVSLCNWKMELTTVKKLDHCQDGEVLHRNA